MIHTITTENLPWIDNRKDPDTLPVYKIIARSMSSAGDSIVMLHKAGSDFVENYYIRDLVNDHSIMKLLNQKEADLLRWVVHSEVTDPLKDLNDVRL